VLQAFTNKNGELVSVTIGGHSVIYFDNEEGWDDIYCSECANKPENIARIKRYVVIYSGKIACDVCGREIQ
jgi:hypothetical protein